MKKCLTYLLLSSVLGHGGHEATVEQVSVGNHYRDGNWMGLFDFELVNSNLRTVEVTFDANAAAYEGITCMSSWNKLWG